MTTIATTIELNDNQKNLRSEASEIVKKSNTLGQVVKAFGGMGGYVLKSGRTVNDWFADHGVDRTPKNNRVPSLAVKDVQKAWADALKLEVEENGKTKKHFALCKWVKGHATIGENTYEVFCFDGKTYKPAKVYKLVAIGENAWSTRRIVEGMNQSVEVEKHVDKMVESELAFAETNDFYIRKESEKDGALVVEYSKVTKGSVKF